MPFHPTPIVPPKSPSANGSLPAPPRVKQQRTLNFADATKVTFPVVFDASQSVFPDGVHTIEVDNNSSLVITITADGQPIRTIGNYSQRWLFNVSTGWNRIEITASGTATAGDTLAFTMFNTAVQAPLASSPAAALAPGAVSLGSLAIKGPRPYIDPTAPYYGADPTGAKAASDALNNAFADAVTEGAAVVFPSASKFNIDKQLVIQDASGLFFGCASPGNLGGYKSGGAGPVSVQLIWNGTNGGNPILFNRCRDSTLQGMQIIPGAGTIGVGIDYDSSGTNTNGGTTNNKFVNMCVFDPTLVGIRIDHSQGANCDMTELYNFIVARSAFSVVAGSIGISIEYTQSKNTKIFGGNAGYMNYGISTKAGFKAFGFNFESNTIDIQITDNGDTVEEFSPESESSGRHIYTTAGSSAGTQVSIYGGRLSPDSVNTDGRYIYYTYPGVLNLHGCAIASGSEQASVSFYVPGVNAYGKIVGKVSAVGCQLPNPSPLGTTAINRYILGCLYPDSSGVSQTVPDVIGPNPSGANVDFKPMTISGMVGLQGYAPGFQTITASTTLTTQSSTVISSGSGTVATLPAASDQEGQIVTYIRKDSANNQVLSTAGADVFYGGATTKTLGTDGASVQVQSDGTSVWYVLSTQGTVS